MATDEHIRLFMSCFVGRTDAYGTYDLRTGKVWQVKEKVTDAVVRAHLDGYRPMGLYLLTTDTIRASVVDFDVDDRSLPLGFVSHLRDVGLPAYVERSKSKGYHVWVFYAQEGVKARTARLVLSSVLAHMQQRAVEVFPKQDRLDAGTFYGNFINLPLFGPLVSRGRSVFVDATLVPIPDQWSFLAGIQRVSAGELARACKGVVSDVDTLGPAPAPVHRHNASSESVGTYALYPCAQRMLKEGVSANQRTACFRLATQLRKAGLPFEYAVLVLGKWASKNRPDNGRGIITDGEILSQTQCAYRPRAYRACGCDDPAVSPFCEPAECPIGRRRQLARTASSRVAGYVPSSQRA